MYKISDAEPYTKCEEAVARALCWANGMNPDLSLGGDQQNWLWHEYVYPARVAMQAFSDNISDSAKEYVWKTTEPPKDRKILVYGKPNDIELLKFYNPGVHLVMWDYHDSAFALDGSTWLGPFIDEKNIIRWTEAPKYP